MKTFFCFVIGLFLFSFPVKAANYSLVDNIAKNAKEYPNLRTLVKEITKSLRSDEEKARVIYAWIVYHIEYDDYKASVIIDGTTREKNRLHKIDNDIYKTRTGVCADIADLYQKMAQIAGLESVYISGYAGRNMTKRNLDEHGHAWNAVKIKGKWQLVDATWGINGGNFGSDIKNASRYKYELQKKERDKKGRRATKNKAIDNSYFLTEPKELIKTHYPHDEKWQLIKPTKTLNRFLREQKNN